MPGLIRHPVCFWIPAFAGMTTVGYLPAGLIETVTTAINIMQDRITRINHAVTPPDVLIRPHLGELKMLDFDQVDHTIEEGYTKAKAKIDDIKSMLETE